MLVITVPNNQYNELSKVVFDLLDSVLKTYRMESVREKEEETVISCGFKKLGKEDLLKLQSEVKQLNEQMTLNVFFNSNNAFE